MTDLMKTAFGSSAILAVGFFMAAKETEPRFSIIATNDVGAVWRLDRRSGEVSICGMNYGCQTLKPATAQNSK